MVVPNSGAANFPVVSSYKAYKKRTSKIKEYLLKTADKIGYQSKRSKSTSQPAADLKVSEFVEYASAIQQQPGFEIPDWIVSELKETLNLRRRVARFYTSFMSEKHGAGDASETDGQGASEKGHSHFISVLERVLYIFKPKESMSNAKADQSSRHTDVANITNRFGALNMDEPLSQVAHDHQPMEVVDKYGNTSSIEEFLRCFLSDWEEELEDTMEGQLEAFCLFEDLNAIRSFVVKLWEELAKDGVNGAGLISVSLVTNTAMDLAKRLDEEFRQSHPECTSYSDIIKFAVGAVILERFRNFSASNGGAGFLNLDEFFDSQYRDNYLETEESNILMYSTFMNLKAFMGIADRNYSSYLENPRPTPQDLPNRSTMTWQEKRTEDQRVLRSALPEFFFGAMGCKFIPENKGWDIYYGDEINRGMKDRIETGATQIWFVFALQLYIDIYNAIGGAIQEPFDELRRTAQVAKASLAICLREEKKLSADQGETYADYPGIQLALNVIDEWVLTDNTHRFLIHNRGPISREPFYLHKRHPLMCGTILFNLQSVVRQCAFKLIFSRGSIETMAHLYNSAHQVGELERWSDMEAFVEIHENTGMFYGKRPRTRKACLSVYKAFMEGQDRKCGYESIEVTPIAVIFANHYSDRSRAEWGTDQIEAVVRATQPGTSKRIREQTATNGLSAIALLQSLHNLLIAEVPKIRFDYLSMHRRCMRLLVIAREAVREYSSAMSSPTASQLEMPPSFSDEREVANIVGCILTLSVTIEKHLKKKLRFQAPQVLKNTALDILVRAADAMKPIVEREGSFEVKKLGWI